jgi:hypothetical protein
MWHISCTNETWGSHFDFGIKIYPLMPFDAFNGSLVEDCLISDFRLHIGDVFTQPRDKKGRITKRVSSGGHRSDRRQPFELGAGDPTPLPGWPGASLSADRWPDTYDRVTREWTVFHKKWWFGIEVLFVCAQLCKLLISSTLKRTSKS